MKQIKDTGSCDLDFYWKLILRGLKNRPFCLFPWYKISCSPGWSWMHHGAMDKPKVLTFLLSHPKYWDYRYESQHCLGICILIVFQTSLSQIVFAKSLIHAVRKMIISQDDAKGQKAMGPAEKQSFPIRTLNDEWRQLFFALPLPLPPWVWSKSLISSPCFIIS